MFTQEVQTAWKLFLIEKIPLRLFNSVTLNKRSSNAFNIWGRVWSSRENLRFCTSPFSFCFVYGKVPPPYFNSPFSFTLTIHNRYLSREREMGTSSCLIFEVFILFTFLKPGRMLRCTDFWKYIFFVCACAGEIT